MTSASHEPPKEEWMNMELKDLEEQYSPSRWSKRYGPDEIIGAHVKEATQLSKAARADLPRPPRLDVPYGSAPRAKLDVYGEDLPGDSPVMVYVHGGYWQELNKDISAYLVEPLYKEGIVSVIVGYDLAPQVSVEDIVEEVRAAVGWACALAKGRGSKCVVLSGWSAGAHLVTQVLSTWSSKRSKETTFSDPEVTSYALDLIRGVVTFSGVFDLRPLVKTYVNEPLNLTDIVEGLSEEDFPVTRRILGLFAKYQAKEEVKEACGASGLKADPVDVSEADHFSIVEGLSEEDFPVTRRILDLFAKYQAKEEVKEA
ncbi:kynurenine formamidase-like [Penaeus japonicus]|uniref:kynurenine formamidase-like n=1 Tax=Penaeus japonicus TaxID=27405 RepID=UPI001C70FE51|nr:kynurenine formamidase-like [Penaeus japonicus]